MDGPGPGDHSKPSTDWMNQDPLARMEEPIIQIANTAVKEGLQNMAKTILVGLQDQDEPQDNDDNQDNDDPTALLAQKRKKKDASDRRRQASANASLAQKR